MFSFFNVVMAHSAVFLLLLCSGFTFFTFRQLFIRRTFLVLIYYAFLSIVFVIALAGGSVQNDAYKRYGQFVVLEQQGLLEDVRNNPQQYDGMFQIDLQQFKNAAEFRAYLSRHDAFVDTAEAVSFGWVFAVVAECSLLFACLVC